MSICSIAVPNELVPSAIKYSAHLKIHGPLANPLYVTMSGTIFTEADLSRRTTAVTDAAVFDVDVSNDAAGGFGSPLGYPASVCVLNSPG
jgi:hypothetical protein